MTERESADPVLPWTADTVHERCGVHRRSRAPSIQRPPTRRPAPPGTRLGRYPLPWLCGRIGVMPPDAREYPF
jgi:hypothetical protein